MRTLTLSVIFAFILSATVLQTSQKTITVQGHSVTVNVSPHVQCWRLIHDGKKVIALFESTGITQTINVLYCATTEQEAQAEITRLKLTPLPPAPPQPCPVPPCPK
jgi:hypothetical protein